jgi:two-component system sensor histidine kinase SenX3
VDGAVVVAVGLLALVVAGTYLWSARRATARLRALAGHRGDDPPPKPRQSADRRRGLGGAVADVERAVHHLAAARRDDRSERVRLTDALQALPVGVIVADETGQIVTRNGMAARYVGARHADAIVEAVIAELVTAALAAARADADEDPELRRELDLVGPPRRALDVRARALGAGPGPRGAVVTIRDITDIRRVEQVRRDFIANVSHELKTPIGALAVLADTLADEDDGERSRQLATRLAEEAERLGRIVHDLLDLSVLEALDELPRARVSVPALLEEAAARVRSAAALRDITLVAEPSPTADDDGEGGAPPADTVSVDRPRLVSALFNLLDNAVKYSEPGSTVRLEAHGGPGVVTFVVHDQGCGISARDRERVFERFYRVDRARSRETGGTGLGLAFVRHVAEAHGGRVWVDSEEGVGSTFRLAIPVT